MPPDAATRLELYKLYLATAESVSDRRASANAWMLSINSAIVALYGYLAAAEGIAQVFWLLAIPAVGILVSATWASLLSAYATLNAAKFKVLQELERELAVPLFKREQEIYKQMRRRRLSLIEGGVPWCFAILYMVMFVAALASHLTAD